MEPSAQGLKLLKPGGKSKPPSFTVSRSYRPQPSSYRLFTSAADKVANNSNPLSLSKPLCTVEGHINLHQVSCDRVKTKEDLEEETQGMLEDEWQLAEAVGPLRICSSVFSSNAVLSSF